MTHKYRADIDGLRAIAVLAVVIYHVSPKWLRSGFIGVDVFFVISGFLISTILFKATENQSFTFSDFYIRRVKRIFPALIVVLISCFVFGWFSLLANEYKQFGKHLSGAGIISNFFQWQEEGYFDNAAETKPLLHLWSLGIEEQFYIVWPLIIWSAWKSKFNILWAMVIFGVLSFLLNIWRVESDPLGTFYLPHTRAWELLSGSILAWFTLYKPREKGSLHQNISSTLGLVLIAIGMSKIGKSAHFPGFWALLPIGGSVLIIYAGPGAWINRKILSHRLLVWFGLISYPLYLWHWPLLSFARILESDTPSIETRMLCVVVSVFLAWLTYKFIERPIRFWSRPQAVTPWLLSLMGLVMIAGLITYYSEGLKGRPMAQAGLPLSEAKADWKYNPTTLVNMKIENLNVLQGQKEERVLFIGDSTMGQYYPRAQEIYSHAKKPLLTTVFASRNHCRPLPLFDQISGPEKISRLDYYQAALTMASEKAYVKIVFGGNWPDLSKNGTLTEQADLFARDIKKLRELGKQVYIITNPLLHKFFDPTFIAKEYRLRPARIVPDKFLKRDQVENLGLLRAFELLAKKSGAVLINPHDYFCRDNVCPYLVNNEPLFNDSAHLRAKYAAKHATFIDELIND